MITIAVLLTVHNRREKTLRCLEFLKNTIIKDVRYSVFLVDDGSTDGTTEAIKRKYPSVNVVKGNGRLFWNRGMRLAWKSSLKAKCDFFLWLNDDTILMNDAFERLLRCSAQCENKSIIVGSTFSSKENLTHSYGGRTKKRDHLLIKPNDKEVVECDVFNGNIVLIPYGVFEKVGLYD